MHFVLRFNHYPTLNLAVSILESNEVPFQIGACPFDLHFFTDESYRNALAELGLAQIWPMDSFKGGPDFVVMTA